MIDRFIDASKGIVAHNLGDITLDTMLGDLPIDSLDLYSVIENLEDESGKTLEDDAFEKMDTVGDLVGYFFGPAA